MHHRLHIRPARSYQLPPGRHRLLYAVLVTVVVAAGMLWRSGLIPMPGWLSNNGGDALWALMVFVGCGFLLPRTPTLTLGVLALTFAWGVEFSQLYPAPWLDGARATFPGRLVLGTAFCWSDLVAYAVGVMLGAWVEWRCLASGANDRH